MILFFWSTGIQGRLIQKGENDNEMDEGVTPRNEMPGPWAFLYIST